MRPGSDANCLIAGHRDLNGQLGSFRQLETLQPGDVVEVLGPNGAKMVYGVEWVRSYPTGEAPLDLIFAPSQEPVLTLITCGGTFDRQRGDYRQRVVVRARLLG